MDSGKFDWKASGKFGNIADPNPSYHGKGNAVVAGVGVSNVAELAACLPVELAAVHNDAAQRGACLLYTSRCV